MTTCNILVLRLSNISYQALMSSFMLSSQLIINIELLVSLPPCPVFYPPRMVAIARPYIKPSLLLRSYRLVSLKMPRGSLMRCHLRSHSILAASRRSPDYANGAAHPLTTSHSRFKGFILTAKTTVFYT